MIFFDTLVSMILTIFALIFAILFGYSLTHLPVPILQIRWQIWAGLAAASAIGMILCLVFSRPKKQECNEDLKQAMKGHLKISILFWSYFTKKEKVKTLEEAKREVFQDVKREFSQLPWMQDMIEEIRQELAKYK